MTIDGVGARTSFLGTQLLNLQNQFNELQTQLATGKKSDTYAGMGVSRGFAIGLRQQISAIDSFTDTATNVATRLNVADTALTRIAAIGTTVQGAASSSSTQITSNGQTTSQKTAHNSLDEMLQLLNIQSGDRYLFSGRATDTPATASIDDILNGVGAKAGLKQLIAERNQADLGTGTGRLVLATPTATSISIAEDAAGSPFGLKLAAISSSSPSVTLTGPTGSPPAETLDLGATNPNPGDTLTFAFNLPDGSTENIQLTAAGTTPLKAGQYLIGANSTATAREWRAGRGLRPEGVQRILHQHAATARQRTAIQHGDITHCRHAGEYAFLVHGGNRPRSGARYRGRASRSGGDRAVWRAGQRAGVHVAASDHRRLRRRHHLARRSERQCADLRAL
jgi:flagellin-like hook-associated protein FlgL